MSACESQIRRAETFHVVDLRARGHDRRDASVAARRAGATTEKPLRRAPDRLRGLQSVSNAWSTIRFSASTTCPTISTDPSAGTSASSHLAPPRRCRLDPCSRDAERRRPWRRGDGGLASSTSARARDLALSGQFQRDRVNAARPSSTSAALRRDRDSPPRRRSGGRCRAGGNPVGMGTAGADPLEQCRHTLQVAREPTAKVRSAVGDDLAAMTNSLPSSSGCQAYSSPSRHTTGYSRRIRCSSTANPSIC